MMDKTKKKSQDPLKKYRTENPRQFQMMETRKKLMDNLDEIKDKMKILVEKHGLGFLPLLFVCSDTASDIMQISDIPSDFEKERVLANRMGEVTASVIKDAYGFILVSVMDDKDIALDARSINGEEKVAFLSKETPAEWMEENKTDTFLGQLWTAYRVNLITNISV